MTRTKRTTLEALGVPELKRQPLTAGLLIALLGAAGWLLGQAWGLDDRQRKIADQAVLQHEVKLNPHPQLDTVKELHRLVDEQARQNDVILQTLTAAQKACADTGRQRRRRR